MKPLFEETIPVFIKYIGNLIKLIEKAEAHARKKKIPADSFLTKRLHPDMYAFREQVGYVYFVALETTGKLTGKPAPKLGYDEKSMEELKKSLQVVQRFLKTIKPSDFKAGKGRKILLFLDEKTKVSPPIFVRQFMLPDFFFHCVVAYAILRHSGVAIGKSDYLGAL